MEFAVPAEPLHDVLESLVRSLVSLYRVTPVRVRVDIDEDPGNPLSWRVKEIVGGVVWTQQATPTPPTPTNPPSQPEPSSNGQAKEEEPTITTRFSPCIGDILDVLEKASKPLTHSRIMAALAKAEKEWSDRTVAQYLANMVKDGTLQNPKDPRRPGYRLPEWETTSDETD